MAHPTEDRNYRLPRHVRPTAYDAMISVDLEGRRFAGTLRIELQLDAPTDEIVLHAAELDVARARVRAGATEVEPVATTAAPASETVVLRFASPLARGKAALELAWAGRMTDGLRGLYPAGDGIAATQFEAADARRVFPCFDEPGFKAPWRLAVEAPSGVAVLSNSAPASEEDLDGRRRIRFAETPPLPTYLVALVLGRVDAHLPVSVRGVPVRTFAQPAKLALTGFGQDVAVEVLPRLEDYFGVPYAFGKLDQVGLPEFEAGAMENAGLITYREVALLLDPATASLAAEEAGGGGRHPRARAPVVRELGDDDLVGRPLAQRGLRHLDGLQDRRPVEPRLAGLARVRPGEGRRAPPRRAALHAPGPRRDPRTSRRPPRRSTSSPTRRAAPSSG